jgi:serine/threonine protein kinase
MDADVRAVFSRSYSWLRIRRAGMVGTTAADERARRRSPNGGYRLLKSIARGGYAEVFLAEHREHPGHLAAFKRPLDVPLARERMVREIEVQHLFRHLYCFKTHRKVSGLGM